MWINEHVNLPEELLTAQRDGRLVVFVGAGVSMGPPSSLPDFHTLASRVANPTLPPPNRNEALDRYLGIAEQKGVDVQAITRRILDDPASLPTPLHHDLVALFPRAEVVRIVTTNFDPHLTTTGEARFGADLETYYAPALPPGRSIRGVVYLHGSLRRPQEPLVLTDGDFGRAYLTEGWATRMLMEMFSQYVVLFVGYSHSDPVMRYLARGLVPGTSRYALAPATAGTEEWWRTLDITPVLYPLRDGPASHAVLGETIAAWAARAAMGALDHENRIRTIVQDPPSLDPERQDYVRAALDDPVNVRFFTRHAASPEWLEWAASTGVLDPLFRAGGTLTGPLEELALWFGSRCAIDHLPTALEIVASHGGALHPRVCGVLARELGSPDARPDPLTVSRWVPFLLGSAESPEAHWALSSLTSECRRPEERGACVLLFRRLTEPRLHFDRVFGVVDQAERGIRLNAEVGFAGDVYSLRRAWEEVLRPDMTEIASDLAIFLSDHLAQSHRLMRAVGAANGGWDPMSFRRRAIEAHEQDRWESAFDLLVDCARDVIEWLLRERPTVAAGLIESWREAAAPILQRLAIHAMAEDPNLDAERALDEVIERRWLYAFGLKHEVFRLIERAYPRASAEAREQLIAYSLEEQTAGGAAGVDGEREIRDYERFNVAVWLNRATPDCELATRHLEALQAAHPEFGPRDHPDLDFEMGRVERVILESPVVVDQLLARPAAEWVNLLVEYREERWRGPSREGLMSEVGKAVEQNPSWGWELAVALAERNVWEPDVWIAVLSAWKAAPVTSALWPDLLAFFEQRPELDPVGRAIADLLEQGVESGTLPIGVLDLAERIADRLYGVAVEPANLGLRQHGGWLGVAINHLAGDVAGIWLHALSRRRAEAGSDWTGIPEGYRERFRLVLESDSTAAGLVATVLASQLPFLFALDSKWVKRHLVPLFDWNRDALRAEQAWHGFLLGGHFNEPLLVELLPHLQECFGRLGVALAPVRESMCQHLAGIAVHSGIHPIESGWLLRFVMDAEEEDLRRWAADVANQLETLAPEAKQDIWGHWIRDYWAQRLVGVPRPLAEVERTELVGWALELGPAFPPAVEMVRRAPVAVGEERMMFYRMNESEQVEAFPDAFARLLRHLLASTVDLPLYECEEIVALVRRLVAHAAAREDLLTVCDEMTRLGCAGGAELQAMIRGAA